jgi:hypothetical protein
MSSSSKKVKSSVEGCQGVEAQRRKQVSAANSCSGLCNNYKVEIDKARFDDSKQRHRIELAKAMIADPTNPR